MRFLGFNKYLKCNACLLFILLFLISCNQPNTEVKEEKKTYKELQKPLMDANRRVAKFEDSAVEKYVKRNNWKNPIKTGTGLWFSREVENSSGIKIEEGFLVTLHYTVKLLDGTVCYKTEKPDEVIVAYDQKESGLHEALQYLHDGEKANIAMPSHLAHGLLGDRNKIPMKSAIVYELEIISVKK